MGNVVELAQQRSDVAGDVDANMDEFDELGQKVDWIIEAIDKQKAEIAQFRARMDRLRSEMNSLDKTVNRYRARVDSIPHQRLQRQARSLEALLAGQKSE